MRGTKSDDQRTLLPFQAVDTLQIIRPSPRPITIGEELIFRDAQFPTTHFDFFRRDCVPELAAQSASEFWLRLVLQACHSEESVLHAALAFGTLHRVYKDNGISATDKGVEWSNQKLAYRQYHRAVTSLQSKLCYEDSHSTQVALIACVLLVCFDLMANRYRNALNHLKGGLKILRECRHEGEGSAYNEDLESLALKLGRFEIDKTLLEPLQLLQVQAIFFGIVNLRNPTWSQASVLAPKPLPPNGFPDIPEARRELEFIVECIAAFVAEADEKSPYCSHLLTEDILRHHQRYFQYRLQQWYTIANRLFIGNERSHDFDATSIHVQYFAEWILLSTALDRGTEVGSIVTCQISTESWIWLKTVLSNTRFLRFPSSMASLGHCTTRW